MTFIIDFTVLNDHFLQAMISEEQFLEQIQEIADLMKEYSDWTIERDTRGSNCAFLVKRNHKINHEDDILNLEYHVVRHPSYCVPVLCFNAWKSSGSPILDHETVWSILKSNLNSETASSVDMYSALTQIDHPVTQKPIWALHPCQTPALLEQFKSVSENLVLTLMSTFGPFIGLSLKELQLTHKTVEKF